MRQVLISFYFLSLFLKAEGQSLELKFDRYTVDQGLSHNNVKSLMIDQFGFVWAGTEGGLCRFNGYEFDCFEADEDDTTRLSHNWARASPKMRRDLCGLVPSVD